ncbi:hypothetical protein LguiB_008937 [Lonicera macranthoides]
MEWVEKNGVAEKNENGEKAFFKERTSPSLECFAKPPLSPLICSYLWSNLCPFRRTHTVFVDNSQAPALETIQTLREIEDDEMKIKEDEIEFEDVEDNEEPPDLPPRTTLSRLLQLKISSDSHDEEDYLDIQIAYDAVGEEFVKLNKKKYDRHGISGCHFPFGHANQNGRVLGICLLHSSGSPNWAPLRPSYEGGIPEFLTLLARFDALLSIHIPELRKKLDEFKIKNTMYALAWFVQVYAKFPHEIMARVWDAFLYEIPNGKLWTVNLSISKGEVWLQDGWKEFAEHYSIGSLVFKYEVPVSMFLYSISASEIEYPSPKTIHEERTDLIGESHVKRKGVTDEHNVKNKKTRSNSTNKKQNGAQASRMKNVKLEEMHSFHFVNENIPQALSDRYFRKKENDYVILQVADGMTVWSVKCSLSKNHAKLTSRWMDLFETCASG